MQLPHGWVSVSGDVAKQLEVELHREVPAAHQVHGWQLRAIARRDRRDDVLFLSADGDGPVFRVHLTWSIERDPTWPWTERYDSLDDFRERWPREMVGPTDPVLIRRELPADIDAIRAVHTGAFPTGDEAALVDALRSAGRLTISLVAVEDEQVVGHVGFSPITVNGEPAGLGLAPVAVRSDCRRRGVAALLIRGGLEQCREHASGLVVVLGDPRYYARFGFEPARRYGLRDEYEGADAFQAIEFVHGTVPVGGGLVQYAPEFATAGV